MLYVDPKDRPEEGIIRASVRVGSLDAVVVGEPPWFPAANPALGLNERLPSQRIPGRPLKRKMIPIGEIK